MKCAPTETPQDIDLEALRTKYDFERNKRLKKEGSSQYAHVTGDLSNFFEIDPYAPPVKRDPLDTDIDVAVIGGGFAGLIAGAQLKQAGVKDVHIIDMANDFGGVWYWNRYPGIQCDNESYTYIPLLEELNYMPSKKFPDGAEIFKHCQNIGKHYGLYDGAIFGTGVKSLKWDDATKRWRVATTQNDDIRARFIVMCMGPWSKPKLPGIPGLKDFKGQSFHSARWDYAITGGGPNDPTLDKLKDKRVAIIGTGATSIQIVPHLGKWAKELYVFQRTPSSVDERGNKPTDPEWAKSLKPGWQRERQQTFHNWAWEPFPPGSLGPAGQYDVVCDFWTEVNRNILQRLNDMGNPQLDIGALVALREEEDYKVMERLRRRIDSIITDKETAEALKPYYRFMCKRPCSNDDYLPTFNRPNVKLIDVSGTQGVERVTEKGIVANGKEYEVDLIIYASGFEISPRDQKAGWGIEPLAGRNGLSLYDHWGHSFKTFHGMTSHGFPNQFFTGFTQAGAGANTTAIYEQQGEHIAYVISEAMKRGAKTVEPTAEAEAGWVQTIRDNTFPSDFLEKCTPGYYNNEGGGDGGIRGALGEPYGPGFYAFGDLIKAWRDKGELEGLELGK